jgi:hypothetical protein
MYANLSSADLAFADLKEATLFHANLACAGLQQADLSGANLMHAYLAGAYLHGANLTHANLSDVTFSGACLTNAQLMFADLSDAFLAANISEANLGHAKGLPVAPVVPRLHAQIVERIDSGAASLDMDIWHTCETTHCRAGWAVHLAGPEGYALEEQLGTNAAGALIIIASTPALEGRVPNLFAETEDAMEDIRRLAALGQ